MKNKIVYQIKDISAGYLHSVKVINGIRLDVMHGEFVGIIGPNGAGKTTLLRCLCRLIGCSEGEIYLFDKELNRWKIRALAQKVALVQQIPKTIFDFTVNEVVSMGRFPYLKRFEWAHAGDHEKVISALQVTDSFQLMNRRLSTLSGGELQRVMLARALAQEPNVLLLDEPTTHLDINHQWTFFQLLQRLNREQELTVIAVLHDLNNAALFCHRLLLMAKGKILADGTPGEVINEALIKQVFQTSVIIGHHPEKNIPQIYLRS